MEKVSQPCFVPNHSGRSENENMSENWKQISNCNYGIVVKIDWNFIRILFTCLLNCSGQFKVIVIAWPTPFHMSWSRGHRETPRYTLFFYNIIWHVKVLFLGPTISLTSFQKIRFIRPVINYFDFDRILTSVCELLKKSSKPWSVFKHF